VLAHTGVVETQTWRSRRREGTGRLRLVELRGIRRFRSTALRARGGRLTQGSSRITALVQRDLLREFARRRRRDRSPGDHSPCAASSRDRIQRSSGFALGRVYVDLADLRALPILRFAVRLSWC
jgi:hypothetical protein